MNTIARFCLGLVDGVAATAVFLGVNAMGQAQTSRPVHLATNAYSWSVFYAREGKDFGADLASGFAVIRSCGLDGYEPILGNAEDARRIGADLRAAGLEMRSAYVNTTLHRADEAERSIREVLEIAQAARKAGTRILVTNPIPVRWGGPEDKTDDELRTQAAALNRLGKELRALGVTLAYHNHDAELRQAARELHHMMLGTDERYVKLCLDSHWIYRGSGNSTVALYDFVQLYAKRVVEVHLRQSQANVWSEAFGSGDIDYVRLAGMLAQAGVNPHLVLEQAVEAGSPNTMDAAEAHRRSVAYTRSAFLPALKKPAK